MNRRGWLKMLGLAPVVPIAAALPVFATPARPELSELIMRLEARLNDFDLAMKRAASAHDGWISEKGDGTITLHISRSERFDRAIAAFSGVRK